MSQHDFNIANQGFAATRADLNNALSALASNSAGASAPSTTYAYQFWYDDTNDLLKMRNSDDDAWITLASFDQTADEWEVRTAVVQAVDAAGLAFKTDDGTTRLEISDTGNVGIGSAGSFPLDVKKDGGAATLTARIYNEGTDAADDASLRIGIAGTTGQSNIFFGDGGSATVGRLIYDHNSDAMVAYVNASEAIRIDSSGNLLAGRSSAIGGSSSHIFEATGDVAALNAYTSTTVTGRDVFNVRSDIGGAETVVAAVEANGDFQSATNTYGSTSDERIKQDIVDASSQYEDVKNMRLRKYKLKAHVETMGADAPEQLGVVAQELEAAGMSGLVKTDPETGMKSVRYSVMYLKALGALQEAMERIETLETKVATLEGN